MRKTKKKEKQMDIVCITHTVICTTYNNKKRVGLENEQEKEKK